MFNGKNSPCPDDCFPRWSIRWTSSISAKWSENCCRRNAKRIHLLKVTLSMFGGRCQCWYWGVSKFFFPCQICQYRLIFHILSRTKQSVYCLPNVVTSRTNKIFVKAWPDVIDSGKFDHWDRHNIITLFLVVPTICDKDMVMICNDIVIIWQSYVKSNYAWMLRVTQFT